MVKSITLNLKNFLINNYIFFFIISKFFLIIPILNSLHFNLSKNFKNFKSIIRRVDKLMWFFILFCIFSNFINKVRFEYHFKFFSLTLIFLSFISMACYFQKNKNIFVNTLRMSLYLNLFIILDILFYKIFNYSLTSNFDNHNRTGIRYASLFFDEKIIGFFLLCSMPLVSIYLKNYSLSNDTLFKKNYFLILLLFVIVIYLTGERRSFILSILTYGYFLYFYLYENRKLKLFLYIISLAIVVLSFFLFFQKSNNNQSLNYRMSGQIIEVIKTVPMAINDRENFIRHMRDHNVGNWSLLYIDGFKIFSKDYKTLILGVGHKQYNIECSKMKLVCSNHPHNMFIELLISYGFVGFTLFCIIISKVIKNLGRDKNNKRNREFIIFIICFFFPLLPSGSIISSNLNFYLLIFGSLFFSHYLTNTKKINY